MALFPMFMDIKGRYCLILGGGSVALRKAQTLLLAGGEVHIWSRDVCEGLFELSECAQVRLEDRASDPKALIQRAFLVVCATSDFEFNNEMLGFCRDKGIFVNCATNEGPAGEEGGATEFIFPSLIVRDTVSVGISTMPVAPSLSKHLRLKLEEQLPQWYGVLGKSLANYRQRLRGMALKNCERARIMGELTEYGICHEGDIPEEMFETIVYKEGKKL